MNKDKTLLDNKGFSFVEVIVVLLITSLLVFGVMAFMSTSRNTYQTVNISATLLEETMTVKRVLSEYIMEAKIYGYQENVVVTGSSTPVKVIWVRARETEKNTGDLSYFFVLDSEDYKLRYCVGDANLVSYESGIMSGDALTLIANECYKTDKKKKYSVIGEHIKAMELKGVTRPDGADMVVIKLTYQYPEETGEKYFDEITVVTRNAIMRGVIVTPTTDPTEPGGENPGGENPGGENPGGENPGGENPGGENPGGENPGGENPGGENPGGENPGGENPGGENPGNTDPLAGIPTGTVNNPSGAITIYSHNEYSYSGQLIYDKPIKEIVISIGASDFNEYSGGKYDTVPMSGGKWKLTIKPGYGINDVPKQISFGANCDITSWSVDYIVFLDQ